MSRKLLVSNGSQLDFNFTNYDNERCTELFTKLLYSSAAEEGYYSSQVQVSFVFVNFSDSGDGTHSPD